MRPKDLRRFSGLPRLCMHHRVIASLLLLGLAGCANAPLIESHVGAPLRVTSFRLSNPPDAAPPLVSREVAAELTRRGFRADEGTQADYLVEVAYADRPVAVAATGPKGAVAPPVKRSLPTYFARGETDLTIRIVEAASGGEVYRGTVRQPHRRPVSGAGPLIHAALMGLPGSSSAR